jgi:hypothetical protein
MPVHRTECVAGRWIHQCQAGDERREVYQHFIEVWPYYIIDSVVFSNCAYRSANRPFEVHLQSIEGGTNGSGEGVEQVPGHEQSAMKERTKRPGRDMLQKLTKGRFSLHLRSTQMVCYAFLANVKTTVELRNQGRHDIRYPYDHFRSPSL